jgi:murein DD-endopeptidase MepM/ murein hydrolase activator NlpD
VLAVVLGFGIGSRIGSAKGPSAGTAGDTSTRATAGAVLSAASPVREARLGAHTNRPSSLGGLASPQANTPDTTASIRREAVFIDALPIYQTASIQGGVTKLDDRITTLNVKKAMQSTENLFDPFSVVTRGEIGRGESLGSSLNRQGISPSTVHLIATEMRKVFDFRRSRPGDKYRLGQDSDGRVLDFRYSQSAEESFYLAWEGTRYVVRKETAELRPLIAKIAGIVDSSFYGAIVSLGEQNALASEFARILAWDIDFSRQVHPGDEFQILYERLYRTSDDGQEVYVRPGRVLAGRYAGKAGDHTVVYFEDDSGEGAYFRPDGSSVERAFLAAPLEFSRISSRFTRARAHPILKVTRPHPGIDYAAPHGTPIWAVADGVVEYRARAGASGNLIRIRHMGGMTSHYAHLASFAKGLKVGDRVSQKEIIGYVGSTGLSTGPHVCFRVKRDGTYIDPMKISGPAGDPVAISRQAVFRSVRDQLLADLGQGPLAMMADEAL